MKYRRATPELIETLDEATAISAGDLVCGPHESERMIAALLRTRVKSDYHLQRLGGELKIGQRLVTETPRRWSLLKKRGGHVVCVFADDRIPGPNRIA